MRALPTLMLAIAIGAMLSGCASRPSMPLTAPVIERTPRWECTVRCPQPPVLQAPRETWELEVLDWGLQCKALHDDCVEDLVK